MNSAARGMSLLETSSFVLFCLILSVQFTPDNTVTASSVSFAQHRIEGELSEKLFTLVRGSEERCFSMGLHN